MTFDWLAFRLLHDVTAALCVADHDVLAKPRTRQTAEVVRARAIFFWLLVELSGETYSRIGKWFAIDHTTVRYNFLIMDQALKGTLARPTKHTRPNSYYTFGLRLVLEQAKISARILGTAIEQEEATT